MGWSIGYDDNWKRDIGYGVPAYCDKPGCNTEIDRGLSYVCGEEPYGGIYGCGLYFCAEHLGYTDKTEEFVALCRRCMNGKPPYKRISREHPEWLWFKANDESWAEWRKENPVQAKFAAENSRPMREAWKDADESSGYRPVSSDATPPCTDGVEGAKEKEK